MKSTSAQFEANARRALDDETLQSALARARSGFVDKRSNAIAECGQFDQLRAAAIGARERGLADMAGCLERFEARVTEHGGQVHWAETGAELNAIVTAICAAAGARRVTRGKSMIGEETGLNAALEAAGLEVTETDLGEYIIQLAGEPPSHIIAPAVHKTRAQVSELFRDRHDLGERPLDEIRALVDEARSVLRARFLAADVGITGANFLVAETGSAIVVTNEGNGDLTANLPRVHVVIASIDKVVDTLEDATALLRVLGRSATGQAMTAYTSLFSGPRRPEDPDGPEQFHVVLLDNGRSDIASSEFADILRCIRCGACLNHCPVYMSVGGHAYGWVYPGPMGAVLTPLLTNLPEARQLPDASTLCGRCEEVCPMDIPLPDLLRKHRAESHRQKLDARGWRTGVAAHAWLARRPRLYRWLSRVTARLLALAARGSGRLRRFPPAPGWTAVRDLPAPEGRTFTEAWENRGNDHER